MDSSTFSYPSTDLWKPVTSRSCTRRRCKPHSGSWFLVLQQETRNQKFGTFTSYNHISQNRRLTTEDFHCSSCCPHRFCCSLFRMILLCRMRPSGHCLLPVRKDGPRADTLSLDARSVIHHRTERRPEGGGVSAASNPPPHPYNGQPARCPFMGIGTPKNKRKHSINRLSNHSF